MILDLPGSLTVIVGTPLKLSAQFSAADFYQWFQNGVVVEGSETFIRESAEFTDSGTYRVVATSVDHRAVQSRECVVTVIPPPRPGTNPHPYIF